MAGSSRRRVAGVVAGALLMVAMLPASVAAAHPAARLVFGVQPSNTVAGATISPAVTVKVEDANGDVVTGDSSLVTLALGSNPGAGTLSGTATTAASAGVATFGTLSINHAGVGYTLVATDGSLRSATSAPFTVVRPAARLVFGVQPSNTAAGATIRPAVTVKVEDANGHVVTSSSASVTIAILANPGAGTLSGTTTMAASAGVVTFGTLSINNVGVGYTLVATSSGLTSTTSSTFSITSSNRLVFTTQPGGGTAGGVWSQQPVVAVENSSNQVVTRDNATIVYLAIATNPVGGTLSCAGGTGLRVVGGYAHFSGCSINLGSSSSYTLSATSNPVRTAATSGPFLISVALTPVTLTDAIAPGVNRGTSGFSTRSVVVPRNGYITVLAQTSPNLAGSVVQIWVESRTSGWHVLTLRLVAADGTVHYYARVNGWTAYWIKFAGNSTYAPAASHGRVATNPT
jgi:hypothetical protein